MKRLLVVLDFDGTFTDVEVEGAPFTDAYREGLSDLVGRDIDGLWKDAEAELDDPEAGWTVNGSIVAPANCDPYIRATCIAFSVCNELGLLKNLKLRTEMLQVLYGLGYAKTATAFRPDAQETLSRLRRSGAVVHVVTNSEPTKVRAKLKELGAAELPVVGNAKKYFVDSSDPSVSTLEDIAIPGLKRRLLVRRPAYRQVLEQLWKDTGTTPAQTLVCGDIFELDLALPLRLGCLGHLLLRPNVPSFERQALASFGEAATASADLGAVADRVEKLVQG